MTEAEESEEETEFLPSFTQPSLSTLDTSEMSEVSEDKWLIQNKSKSLSASTLGTQLRSDPQISESKKRFRINNADKVLRMCAMACACTFGVGSHFASHMIGPMKGILMQRLDLTNTQFSLLIASLTLCNTVIPIVSGLLVARFGTTKSSLVITTGILIGMIIVTTACWTGNVGVMIAGFIVFGTGLAPLTIVQETIIVQFFYGNSLGFALAVGLTFGRLASFVATVLAVPLSMMPPLTYRNPFIVATLTCLASWIMNLMYIYLLRKADNRKASEGGVAMRIAEKKRVHWNDIFDLSDIFWWSLVVGVLFGSSMTPFLHLSRLVPNISILTSDMPYRILRRFFRIHLNSNIIKHRYDMSDLIASWDASIILLLPVIVYPFLGLFMDKYGCRLWILIFGSAAFLVTFLLLLAPPGTIHPFPPIFIFAAAYSVVPLTSVTLIPLLTKHVSTGLGLLKSVDNIGATLSQTISGLLLDAHMKRSYKVDENGIERGHEDDDLVVLRMFAFISVLGLISCLVFWWADKKYKRGSLNAKADGSHENIKIYGHLGDEEDEGQLMQMHIEEEPSISKAEASQMRKRVTIYLWIMGMLLGVCWTVFMVVAIQKGGVHASVGPKASEDL
ncbi:4828_t:CDS:2 [Acaulospora colombiana]|uniref:4828_t:CDS:1 n=1 Tax=Acaulospora colombiana TaxID=27376 RepID=A0ACA9KV84_9GLOM|nr:4828_t:CDS:2 [Acaulospora colombiana]